MWKSHVGNYIILTGVFVGLQKSKSLQEKTLYLETSYQGNTVGEGSIFATAHVKILDSFWRKTCVC